jgi:hypothetical protein
LNRGSAVLLFASASLLAQPRPVIRIAISPESGVIVGQPVRVTVSVLAPNYMTGAPKFPELHIPNAVSVLPDEQSPHLNETIDGATYVGLSRTYLVYPQAPGVYRLPAESVTVTYASDPPKTTEAALPLPPVQFEARVPAEAAGLPYFLPTAKLTVRQRIDNSLSGLKAGDSVRRIITVTADKTQPMILPPVEWQAPDGIRIYPEQPKLNTIGANRAGFVAGEREDSARYLILEQGDYELPAVKVVWWDLQAGEVRESVAPAIRFHADATPGFAPDLAPEAAPVVQTPPEPLWRSIVRRYGLAALSGVALLLALFWIWARYSRPLLQWRRERAERQRNSEPAYYSRLERAVRSGNLHAAYTALQAWVRKATAHRDLSTFLNDAGDPELRKQVEALASSLYSPKPASDWSGVDLLRALRPYRTHLRQKETDAPGLPVLNP